MLHIFQLENDCICSSYCQNLLVSLRTGLGLFIPVMCQSFKPDESIPHLAILL